MIYIAGPMRGMPESNYPAFRRAAQRLRACGHIVVSPVDIGEGYGGQEKLLNDEDLLKRCMEDELRALAECDTIYLLKGWQYSKGALAELKCAIEHGLSIILEGQYP